MRDCSSFEEAQILFKLSAGRQSGHLRSRMVCRTKTNPTSSWAERLLKHIWKQFFGADLTALSWARGFWLVSVPLHSMSKERQPKQLKTKHRRLRNCWQMPRCLNRQHVEGFFWMETPRKSPNGQWIQVPHCHVCLNMLKPQIQSIVPYTIVPVNHLFQTCLHDHVYAFWASNMPAVSRKSLSSFDMIFGKRPGSVEQDKLTKPAKVMRSKT